MAAMNTRIVTQADLMEFFSRPGAPRPRHLAIVAGVAIQSITRPLKGSHGRKQCGAEVSRKIGPYVLDGRPLGCFDNSAFYADSSPSGEMPAGGLSKSDRIQGAA